MVTNPPAKDEAIQLSPYDPTWPAAFDTEAASITTAIGAWITGGIHHVGSTSIPGLAAKPVIDIMAGVAGLESSRACIELLAPLAYLYAPYRQDIMHWFCKPRPDHRTHHLHLVPTGSARFADVLALRDYLRAHPDAAAEYEALKRDLAGRHTHDRQAYTDGKTDLVLRLTATARHWVNHRPGSAPPSP